MVGDSVQSIIIIKRTFETYTEWLNTINTFLGKSKKKIAVTGTYIIQDRKIFYKSNPEKKLRIINGKDEVYLKIIKYDQNKGLQINFEIPDKGKMHYEFHKKTNNTGKEKSSITPLDVIFTHKINTTISGELNIMGKNYQFDLQGNGNQEKKSIISIGGTEDTSSMNYVGKVSINQIHYKINYYYLDKRREFGTERKNIQFFHQSFISNNWSFKGNSYVLKVNLLDGRGSENQPQYLDFQLDGFVQENNKRIGEIKADKRRKIFFYFKRAKVPLDF